MHVSRHLPASMEAAGIGADASWVGEGFHTQLASTVDHLSKWLSTVCRSSAARTFIHEPEGSLLHQLVILRLKKTINLFIRSGHMTTACHFQSGSKVPLEERIRLYTKPRHDPYWHAHQTCLLLTKRCYINKLNWHAHQTQALICSHCIKTALRSPSPPSSTSSPSHADSWADLSKCPQFASKINRIHKSVLHN